MLSNNGGATPTPKGKFELTWTNKHLRLLDQLDGSYKWLEPADWRIAEVRLLNDTDVIGETHSDRLRAKDNLVIEGDALAALRSLTDLPEFAKHYVGQVKCAYLDLPFNTGETFTDYDDALEKSVWLTMFRDRILQVQKLLRDDGSVWVHLDDSEQHRARLVLDEVFGTDCFVGTIIWQKRTSRDNRTAFSSAHDYIHVYAPGGPSVWKEIRNRLPDTGGYGNPDNDPRGPWRSIPVSAQAGHATKSQFYTITTPTGVEHDPPPGNAWRYTPERFQQLRDEGRVYWPSQGNGKPRIKRFPWESEGLVPFTVWLADEVGENSQAKREVSALAPEQKTFDTPKPETLLERILSIATDEGELVLDCFAGSGTTAAVAHKMKRRWVVVERNSETVANHLVPRLARVVDGTDRGGISEATEAQYVGDLPGNLSPGDGKTAARALKAMREHGRLTEAVTGALKKQGTFIEGDEAQKAVAEAVSKAFELELKRADKSKDVTEIRWTGGGGFRVLQVAPSMFEVSDGRVFLSSWATQGRLAAAVAAQLGYEVDGSDSPFVGVKGRRRLAVVDGLVSQPILEALADQLGEGETMEVAGRAVADGSQKAARALRRGSSVRKIPSDVLQGWRRTQGESA